MAKKLVPNTALVVVKGTQFGQETVNDLWFIKSTSGAWTDTELNDLAEAVGLSWYNEMLPNLGNEWFMGDVIATDMSVVGGLQAINTSFNAGVGGTGGGCAPGNVTFAIKFTTGHVGRSYRGRNYVPGIPDGLAGANVLTGAAANAFADAYAAIALAAADAGFNQVVVSFYENKVERTTPLTTIVNGWSYTDVNLDSMRRRLNGRGK